MNGICHIEIPSRDFDKAKKFYGELFGWEFNLMGDMDYMTFKPPDGPGGGFDKSREVSPQSGIALYVEVESIETIIEKARGLGGKCVKDKTQITPEYGYYAVLTDLENNQVCLWAQK